MCIAGTAIVSMETLLVGFIVHGSDSNIVAFDTPGMKQPMVFASCRDQGWHSRSNVRCRHILGVCLRSGSGLACT